MIIIGVLGVKTHFQTKDYFISHGRKITLAAAVSINLSLHLRHGNGEYIPQSDGFTAFGPEKPHVIHILCIYRLGNVPCLCVTTYVCLSYFHNRSIIAYITRVYFAGDCINKMTMMCS
ncbi:unnamed protein product [Acanthoscelides obtectus]|uniref:Uncharacterized protein n=1 Tax=Acanthoscelides obtectus TaxID=200917 RepID=A0A9P0L7F9_ACAOB|nr:unnamed protein product [Acanthoscelides obtectus]CAK1654611.1 hypothetical protein AOBTE_LOCUS18712 [Acanthoscelides obtectus]